MENNGPSNVYTSPPLPSYLWPVPNNVDLPQDENIIFTCSSGIQRSLSLSGRRWKTSGTLSKPFLPDSTLQTFSSTKVKSRNVCSSNHYLKMFSVFIASIQNLCGISTLFQGQRYRFLYLCVQEQSVCHVVSTRLPSSQVTRLDPTGKRQDPGRVILQNAKRRTSNALFDWGLVVSLMFACG